MKSRSACRGLVLGTPILGALALFPAGMLLWPGIGVAQTTVSSPNTSPAGAPVSATPGASAPGLATTTSTDTTTVTTTTAPVAPANPAMMFTNDEYAQILKAVADFQSGATAPVAVATVTPQSSDGSGKAKAPPVPNIHISGVLDLGGGDWTVWANGQRITPATQPTDFTIQSVEGDSVQIVVPRVSNAKITLHPSQTWLASRGSVVEGIVP